MASIFDYVDPQVIFVVVALLIAGTQAVIERRRKLRAARELAGDNMRRAFRRKGSAPAKPAPPAEASFEDLYEEYRRNILTEQQREPGEAGPYTAPWEPPQSEPLPPPLPPPLPVAIPAPAPAPARPVTASAMWQPPKVRRAEEVLTEREKAALREFQKHGRKKRRRITAAATSVPARRLLAGRGGLRTAVILREILGPPKGMF